MSKLHLLLVLGLVLGVSLPASAQDQQTMNRQAEADAAAADKELNAVYKKVLAGLDDEGKALLKTSQRAWIAYRDAEAKFAADEMRGGSAAPLLYSGALASLTKERVKRLRQSLDEGNSAVEKDESPAEPSGAESAAKAGELFYKAYARHDRAAAAKVASKAAIADLGWDASAGSPEGLKLMDPTHIYYVGGSIEMKIKKNPAGRWVVSALEMTAD
jgi:uncharacterized protein YecT (DUF1311 family)